mmetsp:Transcript_11807/g.33256  ORF Transcript_11807/g.33256 Transcript_11807/m.33256 type:complete len:331 (+) Transcript_11807:1632-2624(+)
MLNGRSLGYRGGRRLRGRGRGGVASALKMGRRRRAVHHTLLSGIVVHGYLSRRRFHGRHDSTILLRRLVPARRGASLTVRRIGSRRVRLMFVSPGRLSLAVVLAVVVTLLGVPLLGVAAPSRTAGGEGRLPELGHALQETVRVRLALLLRTVAGRGFVVVLLLLRGRVGGSGGRAGAGRPLLDLLHRDLEHEGGVGWNATGDARRAVPQSRGNHNQSCLVLHHTSDPLVPSGDGFSRPQHHAEHRVLVHVRVKHAAQTSVLLHHPSRIRYSQSVALSYRTSFHRHQVQRKDIHGALRQKHRRHCLSHELSRSFAVRKLNRITNVLRRIHK